MLSKLLVAWLLLAVALSVRLAMPRPKRGPLSHHEHARELALHAAERAVDNAAVRTKLQAAELAQLPTPFPSWVSTGLWWHVHHTDHGVDSIAEIIAKVRRMTQWLSAEGLAVPRRTYLIPILDARWHSAVDSWAFDPVSYPVQRLSDTIDATHTPPTSIQSSVDNKEAPAWIAVPGVVVWATALIGEHERAVYELAIRNNWCLHEGDLGEPPHRFIWKHGGGAPAVAGCLADWSHPDLRDWLTTRVERFLQAHPFVVGLRLAGVDALLWNVERPVGHRGYYSEAQYAKDYYRFFFDVGRRVRGPQFIVVARPVDSFEGRIHFREFAPPDVNFAGWVGDHPFTFAGLREAQMNVIHSAKRGYVSFGSYIGGTPHRDVDMTPELPGQVNRAATFARVGGHPMTESEGAQRRLELLCRWTQTSAMLPLLALSHIDPLGDDVTSTKAGEAATNAPSPTAAAVGTPHQRAHIAALLLLRHAQLSVYIASTAARVFHRRLLLADHVPPVGQRGDDHDPTEWVLRPVAPHRVFYSEPLDWGYALGTDVVVVPMLDSYGRYTTAHLDLTRPELSPHVWVVAEVPRPPCTSNAAAGGGNDATVTEPLQAYGAKGDTTSSGAVATKEVTWELSGESGDPTTRTITLVRQGALLPLRILDTFTVFTALRLNAPRLRIDAMTSTQWVDDPSSAGSIAVRDMNVTKSRWTAVLQSYIGPTAPSPRLVGMRLVRLPSASAPRQGFTTTGDVDYTCYLDTGAGRGPQQCEGAAILPPPSAPVEVSSWLFVESKAEYDLALQLHDTAVASASGCAVSLMTVSGETVAWFVALVPSAPAGAAAATEMLATCTWAAP